MTEAIGTQCNLTIFTAQQLHYAIYAKSYMNL